MFGDDRPAPTQKDTSKQEPSSPAPMAGKDDARSEGAYKFNDWAAI